ncbi:hypothetical protein, partial [Cylindrospermopsis raciborskii]|uniref:hypothetical protein n=1 Tax=Cylindrospermopsis raciborskii TaxID=77022 RepID=UPI001FC94C88
LSHQLTVILIAHRLSTLENAIAFFSWIRDRFIKKAIAMVIRQLTRRLGELSERRVGQDPAIVSTSIRSTGLNLYWILETFLI